MAVRIRVYPQYGGLGGYSGMYGSYGMYGPYGQYGVQTRLTKQQLANERKTNSLRLAYERQLWSERLKMAELQAQVRYGGLGGVQYGGLGLLGGASGSLLGLGALGYNPFSTGSNFFGSLGLGGMF